MDVRYIGTRGMKLHSTMNLNESDFRNNGLLQSLEITRTGGDAPMFDQMFKGLNLGSGIVGTAISDRKRCAGIHPSEVSLRTATLPASLEP